MPNILTDEKWPSESYPVSINFAPRLTGNLQGSTITSASISVTPSSGLTVSTPTVRNDTDVVFRISGGSSGKAYECVITVNLSSAPDVLEERLRVKVK